jgi:hypothetical protein
MREAKKTVSLPEFFEDVAYVAHVVVPKLVEDLGEAMQAAARKEVARVRAPHAVFSSSRHMKVRDEGEKAGRAPNSFLIVHHRLFKGAKAGKGRNRRGKVGAPAGIFGRAGRSAAPSGLAGRPTLAALGSGRGALIAQKVVVEEAEKMIDRHRVKQAQAGPGGSR